MTTISQSTARTHDGVWVLFAVCLAALMLPLSFSGGAIATPSIGRALGGSAASLTWITNAFMLTFGSLLMAAGALADQFGRKRIFAGGVILFVIFSLASSLASSLVAIDLFRAAQGVGAAAALAGGSAAIAQEFDDHARVKAFSLLGTTFGVGLAFGPVLMGLLVARYGWQSIFVGSGTVGIIAIMLGLPRMRETRDPHAAKLDWQGVASFTAMLSLFTFAIIQGPSFGWTNPVILTMFAGAALMAGSFVIIESRAARPMLDLTLFRYPRFVGVQLLPTASCYSYVVLLILLPLRFVGIEGLSEIEAGILMLALSALMLFVPYLAAHAARWISPGVLSAVGLLIAAVGVFWLGRATPDVGSLATVSPLIAALPVAPPMFVIGLGVGLPWGLMDGLSVSVVPKERAGMASGIFNTSKVANEGVALAIVTAALGILTAAGANELAPASADRTLLPEVAQRVVAGDFSHALEAMPGMDRAALVQSYFQAYQSLSVILTFITASAAAVAFIPLRKK
jgi:MFS family permease